MTFKILSATKINSWLNCEFSFSCRYIQRLPQIKTPSGPKDFGSAMHNIIVQYYDKITNETTIPEAHEKIEEAIVEGSDYRIENYRSRVRGIQTRFKEFESARISKGISKPVFLEKRFVAQPFLDLPPIEVIIDAYFEDIGMITDWKFGANEEMNEARLIQGKTYEVVVRMHGYPVKSVLFNNLTVGKQLPMPDVTDGWLESRIRSMVKSINGGQFTKRESGLCKRYCGYKLACDLSEDCPWVV